MRKTVFIAFCFSMSLSVNQTNAQDILKAYIIKPGGDTVKGSLQLEGNFFGKNIKEKLKFKVNFKEENGSFKEYWPADIPGFGYYPIGSNSPIHYEAKKIYKNMAFLL